MSKAGDVICETKKQYRTNVKEVEGGVGSRRIRHLVQQATNKLSQFANLEAGSPYPSKGQEKYVDGIVKELNSVIEKIKEIKDSNRGNP